MFIRAPEAHSRSLVKAISWRILGSIDTFVISYFVTGRLTFAASIASVETFTKIALFYGHERLWAVVPWGQATPAADDEAVSDGLSPSADGAIATAPAAA